MRLAGAFPAFSPDGRQVALTGGNFARLDVMNIDGSARKTLHAGDSRALFSLSWSHHGDRIAFSKGPVFQGPGGKVEILTVRPDGSDLKEITDDPANDGFPAFSPDGKQIVFRSGRDGNKNLYVMDAEGSNVRRLTEGKWTDTMCDWSPTGEWIAFASDRGGGFEVWLIRPDGTGLRRARRRGRAEQSPALLPRRPLDRLHEPACRILGRGGEPAASAAALRRPVRGAAGRHGADPADAQRLRGRDPRMGPRRWMPRPPPRGCEGKHEDY